MCSTGEQLTINQPHIYDCDIPKSLASSVPTMAELCKHRHGRRNSSVTDGSFSSPNRSVSLLSLAGTEFISFAKGASFENGKMIINNKNSNKNIASYWESFLVPEKVPEYLKEILGSRTGSRKKSLGFSKVSWVPESVLMAEKLPEYLEKVSEFL